MSKKRSPVIILASGSPRRRALLRRAGFTFRVRPSGVSENSTVVQPLRRVKELALRKAHAVAVQVKEGLVIGADTLVIVGPKILGKPADSEAAYRMLYQLSGSMHRVITGVAVIDAASGATLIDAQESKVRMKKLPIERLLALSRRHLDKAGAYAIQEKNDPIAKVVSGPYDNVVGLPVALVRNMIRQMIRRRRPGHSFVIPRGRWRGAHQ